MLLIKAFAVICLDASLTTTPRQQASLCSSPPHPPHHFPPDCQRPLVCSNSGAPFSPVEYMCWIFLISQCDPLRALYLHSHGEVCSPVSMVSSMVSAPPHFCTRHYSERWRLAVFKKGVILFPFSCLPPSYWLCSRGSLRGGFQVETGRRGIKAHPPISTSDGKHPWRS